MNFLLGWSIFRGDLLGRLPSYFDLDLFGSQRPRQFLRSLDGISCDEAVVNVDLFLDALRGEFLEAASFCLGRAAVHERLEHEPSESHQPP